MMKDRNMEGPELLKTVVTSAMSKMNRKKAAKPNGTVIKMLGALNDLGFQKITEILKYTTAVIF